MKTSVSLSKYDLELDGYYTFMEGSVRIEQMFQDFSINDGKKSSSNPFVV